MIEHILSSERGSVTRGREVKRREEKGQIESEDDDEYDGMG